MTLVSGSDLTECLHAACDAVQASVTQGLEWYQETIDADDKVLTDIDSLRRIFSIITCLNDSSIYCTAKSNDLFGIYRTKMEYGGDPDGYNGYGSFTKLLNGDTRALGGLIRHSSGTSYKHFLYAGIYTGDSMGIWRSDTTATSGSPTWTKLSGTEYPITVVCTPRTSASLIFVGTNDQGILRSTDRGSSWNFVNSGI